MLVPRFTPQSCERVTPASPYFNHPFLEEDGVPYIEPLFEGGADARENVACLYPARPHEIHFGQEHSELTAALRTAATNKQRRADFLLISDTKFNFRRQSCLLCKDLCE